MKIHLIEIRDARGGVLTQHLNGLMLPILATWSHRQGWDARVSFCNARRVNYKHDCDVVAISLFTHSAPDGYKIADKFRQLGKIVIIGGPHAKCCTDEVREHADLVFIQCNEEAWVRTLKSIEAGEITPEIKRGQLVPSAELRHIPPFKEIKPFYGQGAFPFLLASFGCPYNCDFCSDWNSDYARRGTEEVLADIKATGRRFFIFSDPNFGVPNKDTIELLHAMKPLKKSYSMAVNFAWLKDEVYLELLRDSGCKGVLIGIESLSASYNKNAIGDRESTLDEIIEQIEKIKQYIPMIQVQIIMGLDEDTEETFRLVVELYKRSMIDVIVPHIVTPLPGTPFYDRMKAEGRIVESDWRQFNCLNLTITLKQFSREEFLGLMSWLHRKITSPTMILRKTFLHFKQYRNIGMAAYIFLILFLRLVNMYVILLKDYQHQRVRMTSHS